MVKERLMKFNKVNGKILFVAMILLISIVCGTIVSPIGASAKTIKYNNSYQKVTLKGFLKAAKDEKEAVLELSDPLIIKGWGNKFKYKKMDVSFHSDASGDSLSEKKLKKYRKKINKNVKISASIVAGDDDFYICRVRKIKVLKKSK